MSAYKHFDLLGHAPVKTLQPFRSFFGVFNTVATLFFLGVYMVRVLAPARAWAISALTILRPLLHFCLQYQTIFGFIWDPPITFAEMEDIHSPNATSAVLEALPQVAFGFPVEERMAPIFAADCSPECPDLKPQFLVQQWTQTQSGGVITSEAPVDLSAKVDADCSIVGVDARYPVVRNTTCLPSKDVFLQGAVEANTWKYLTLRIMSDQVG